MNLFLKAAQFQFSVFQVCVGEGGPGHCGSRGSRRERRDHQQGAFPSRPRIKLKLQGAEYTDQIRSVQTRARYMFQTESRVCVFPQIGTYQMALCSKAHNKPFYVVAESFKFVRLYPLNQQDVPDKFKVRLPYFVCCVFLFFLMIFHPFIQIY